MTLERKHHTAHYKVTYINDAGEQVTAILEGYQVRALRNVLSAKQTESSKEYWRTLDNGGGPVAYDMPGGYAAGEEKLK